MTSSEKLKGVERASLKYNGKIKSETGHASQKLVNIYVSTDTYQGKWQQIYLNTFKCLDMSFGLQRQ